MTNHRVYPFRLEVQTPVQVASSRYADDLTRTHAPLPSTKVPATSLKGLLRQSYVEWLNTYGVRYLSFVESIEGGIPLPEECFDAETLFGGTDRVGLFWVSDLTVTVEPEALMLARFNREDRPEQPLSFVKELGPGSILCGRLAFRAGTPGIIRSVILSALHGIEDFSLSLGPGRRRGHGRVSVRLLEVSKPDVFVSHSWSNHGGTRYQRPRVIEIAERLAEYCDVLFDWCVPPSERAPNWQEEEWMNTQVLSAERIVCILTPDFKTRAESGLGGVGYETGLLAAQSRALTARIERTVCVLLEGNASTSTPGFLLGCPTLDFRHGDMAGHVAHLAAMLQRRERTSNDHV